MNVRALLDERDNSQHQCLDEIRRGSPSRRVAEMRNYSEEGQRGLLDVRLGAFASAGRLRRMGGTSARKNTLIAVSKLSRPASGRCGRHSASTSRRVSTSGGHRFRSSYAFGQVRVTGCGGHRRNVERWRADRRAKARREPGGDCRRVFADLPPARASATNSHASVGNWWGKAVARWRLITLGCWNAIFLPRCHP